MMEVTDMVKLPCRSVPPHATSALLGATSQSADDPQFTEAWVELMRTAVAWREAAKARALARGGPEHQRPSFSPTPSKSDPKEVPSPDVYAYRLRWWARQARMGSSRRPADRRGILGTHASGLHRLDEEQDEAKRHVRQGAPLGVPPLRD